MTLPSEWVSSRVWKRDVRSLAQGYSHIVDVGRVVGGLFPQGRYFGNGVGVGFDAVVGFVALKMTHLSGFVSYIVAALKTIFLYYQAPLVRIEYDGQVMNQRSLIGIGHEWAAHGWGIYDGTAVSQR